MATIPVDAEQLAEPHAGCEGVVWRSTNTWVRAGWSLLSRALLLVSLVALLSKYLHGFSPVGRVPVHRKYRTKQSLACAKLTPLPLAKNTTKTIE